MFLCCVLLSFPGVLIIFDLISFKPHLLVFDFELCRVLFSFIFFSLFSSLLFSPFVFFSVSLAFLECVEAIQFRGPINSLSYQSPCTIIHPSIHPILFVFVRPIFFHPHPHTLTPIYLSIHSSFIIHHTTQLSFVRPSRSSTSIHLLSLVPVPVLVLVYCFLFLVHLSLFLIGFFSYSYSTSPLF